MRIGGDLLLAFMLAVGVHAGLGLWLFGGTRETGRDDPGSRSVAVSAPVEAAALAAAWRVPPSVSETVSAPPVLPEFAEPGTPVVGPHDRQPRRRSSKLPEASARDPEPPTVPAHPATAVAAAHEPPSLQTLAGEGPVSAPKAAHRSDPPRRLATSLPPSPTAEAPPDRPPTPEVVAQAAPGPEAVRPQPRPREAGAPATTRREPLRSRGSARASVDADRYRSAWAAAIGAKIARAQRHPGRAHGDGRVRLTLVVARDGRLADARVATSSGSRVLDRAALDAVQRAAPFPSAPAGLAEDWLRFGQWVAFRAD